MTINRKLKRKNCKSERERERESFSWNERAIVQNLDGGAALPSKPGDWFVSQP